MDQQQLTLDLNDVLNAYSVNGSELANYDLYQRLSDAGTVSQAALEHKEPIGVAQESHSRAKRTVRWHQQTLKSMGLLERVPGKRGVWKRTLTNKSGLHEAAQGVTLVAYSTELGCAIWGDNKAFFSALNEPIHLCVTSPPYPLRKHRAYGGVDEKQWVEFIVSSLEPIAKNLAPGGSIVLNVSNDIFEPGRPSRSLYVERMVLALHDDLGLSLMDRWPWVNYSKPPAPTHWACIKRQQLRTAWEPIFWFTNNPDLVRSDNRRVLEAHSESHKRFLEKGNTRTASYGNGAYRLRGASSYRNQTAGSIPRNVIERGHVCADTRKARSIAAELGLPAHPAMFPTAIPEFAIQFLTEPGELVVDPFAGSNKTGLAAERLNRRWLATDLILEYNRVQAELFRGTPGYCVSEGLLKVAG